MIWLDSINENDAGGRGIFINKGGEGKLVWLCYIAWWGVTRLFGVKIVFCYYCWSTDGPTPACYHDFYQRILDKLLVCYSYANISLKKHGEKYSIEIIYNEDEKVHI